MPFALKLPRRNPDAPRPSLRERYAALKGSAAKVIGKPTQFAPPKPIGAGEPSKTLVALIDAHQLAYARYLIARSDWSPDLNALRQAEEAAFRALLHSPLRSDADRVAYAVAVIERQSGALGDHVATGRDHPLSVAYRSLRFGEHAREAVPEPVVDPVGSRPAGAPAADAPPAPAAHDPARLSAEQIDLSALDIFQLSALFEAFQGAKFWWEGVVARPYSHDDDHRSNLFLNKLGELATFEEERASWIMQRLEEEIAERTPQDEDQRDEILMVRTQQEFRCNRRIHDNALLLDISRAWIV